MPHPYNKLVNKIYADAKSCRWFKDVYSINGQLNLISSALAENPPKVGLAKALVYLLVLGKKCSWKVLQNQRPTIAATHPTMTCEMKTRYLQSNLRNLSLSIPAHDPFAYNGRANAFYTTLVLSIVQAADLAKFDVFAEIERLSK